MLPRLAYRFYRLRRLLVVALIPPLLVWAGIFVLQGPVAYALLPIPLVLIPAHLARYPNAFTETLALSLTLCVVLGLAGTIGPDVGLGGLAIRILGLGVLGLVILMALFGPLSIALMAGPQRSFIARARQHSTLDPATLRARITHYPGRADDSVTCGPLDADRMFEITLHHSVSDWWEPDDVPKELAKEVAAAVDAPHDAPFEIKLSGCIIDQTEAEHHLVTVDTSTGETSATRFVFAPTPQGTTVTLEEHSSPMPLGLRFGYWLQDYLADYLLDEVDRAEGRKSHTNRFAGQRQFVVDLAMVIAGWAGPDEKAL